MNQNLTPIIKDSFLQFSGAVLQSRALADVRDNFKPSARQIFYCMYTDKFIHSKPFQKTLKSIGSAFRMYIHGDASAEGVIMRAGQPFAMRYPLVEIEGSYGTLLAASSWAAPRYTSARLSPLAAYIFADLDKDVISEWRDNYDNTEKYPMILPSKGFYNLVNGNFGLGVGASSSIPQYNLCELNQALITLISNPDCTFDEIYCAPDFATGATIINANEVKESHRKGTGFACKIRSTVEWDSKERCFVVTEIPYMVYTETICKELETIIEDESNPGIERFNDLTGEKPKLKIYLLKKANPDKVLKYLYKNTSLQSYYGINFTMLDNGRYPRVFTWKEMLQAHIDHEREVYRRGYEYDLKKYKARIHIIEGLLKAYDMIDEVIHTIKTSQSAVAASTALQSLLGIDDAQAKAILDLKLAKLSQLDISKLQEEKTSLEENVAAVQLILDTPHLLDNQLIEGWKTVALKFGDARRTKVLNLAQEGNEPIEEKQLSISFTNKGAIYASETSTLYVQNRNGVGAKFKLDADERVVDNVVGKNTETILFFTNKGNFYHARLGDFVIGEKQYLSNYVSTQPTEQFIAASLTSNKHYILFLTKNGILKKSEFSEYNLKRNVGAAAIKLDSNDEIVSVLFTDKEQIGILSARGNFIRIRTEDIRPIGRVARGIIGIKLNEGDYVVAAHTLTPNATQLISISSDGYIKRSDLKEITLTGRATKGKRIQKSDEMCDFLFSDTLNDILIVSSLSQIRLSFSDIPLLSLGAQGVKSMKLSKISRIVKLSNL